MRNAIEASVGGSNCTATSPSGCLGFRLAQDLDGSPVVVGRTYTNVGQVDTQGVDLGLQYFVNEQWSLQASYSWFDFEIFDLSLSDVLLPNSPENKASLSVAFKRGRWSTGISGRWVDDFRWSAGVFQGDVFAYHTVDIDASVDLNRVARLGLNVANATDNLHRQTFGGDVLSRRALMNLSFNW